MELMFFNQGLIKDLPITAERSHRANTSKSDITNEREGRPRAVSAGDCRAERWRTAPEGHVVAGRGLIDKAREELADR
jgi:hypothetical protein